VVRQGRTASRWVARFGLSYLITTDRALPALTEIIASL
jgi:hypothetical protein